MNRIKKAFRVVHIVLWTLFILMAALQLSQEGPYWPRLTTAVVLTCLYVFYTHFILLTRYPGKGKKRPYYSRLAAILLTAPLLYLVLHPRLPESAARFLDNYIVALLSIVLPFTFLGWLARFTENLFINTVKKEQLEKQAAEAELHYLKSQINPHFLFNTLNNIHTLVYKQAATAPDAVMQLASLMRYMIYESNAPTVPLTREMKYLQDYMSLQQLRYRQSPVAGLSTEGVAEGIHIAPLLFIHLLENAYKHSTARLAPGELKVRVAVTGDTLTFSVQNPVGGKPVKALEDAGGIGLPNVRKRLALLYPGQHNLAIHNTGETFTVVLTIHGLQPQPHERKAHLLHH
ncbi:sensor histidine kinase [Flaviaesturariibacter flavus]|uniref:Sensor histidine kinase n=1 Tax=Flaviaesturariibacter flavus TaxID=2502780 RepID=A0A4R1B6W7_9BACT|nr:sensor histidine kinase [Flaviaesturariibacter flavus]TCJ12108.1 sensor histidine kinase [Flaviaesturariibacter flavus]